MHGNPPDWMIPIVDGSDDIERANRKLDKLVRRRKRRENSLARRRAFRRSLNQFFSWFCARA